MSSFEKDTCMLVEKEDITRFFNGTQPGDTFGLDTNDKMIYKIARESEKINSSRFSHKLMVTSNNYDVYYVLFDIKGDKFPELRSNDINRRNTHINGLFPNPVIKIRVFTYK